MSKTITFVPRKQVAHTDEDGNEVFKTRNHSRQELVEMVRKGDTGLFSVPAAHALNVIIPQNKYQEVYSDILEEGKAQVDSRKCHGGGNGKS